jgi:DNA-binding XRE family transcriptional regulator
MLPRQLDEVITGTLLSDACIVLDRGKYARYKLTAKDKNFLLWFQRLSKRFSIKSFVSRENNSSRTFSLNIYVNTSPFPELEELRDKWYKKVNDETVKTVPRDLKLTPTTLLFWYLGDGSLIRRKNDSNRVPFIVLATNNFSRVDINFLIQKLKGLNLNFYPVKYKSGFTSKECGYCLYSNTQDGTPFRFFKLIGFECLKEIANCVTGKKGKGSKLHYFKDKWPFEEDWIKILSNIKEIGSILRERRLQLGLSQNQLAKKIGIRRENIRDVELCKRHFRVENFRKVLKALNLNIQSIKLKIGG